MSMRLILSFIGGFFSLAGRFFHMVSGDTPQPIAVTIMKLLPLLALTAVLLSPLAALRARAADAPFDVTAYGAKGDGVT